MKKTNKARKYNSPKLMELFAEITPLEMEKTKVKMQISARIEDLMEQKGWNKSQLAEMVGKHQSEITKWMSGTQNFTIEILTEIAFAFGIDISVLLDNNQIQLIYQKTFVVTVVSPQPPVKISTPMGVAFDLLGQYIYSSSKGRLIN